MLDPRRYQGLLITGGGVLCAFVLLNMVLALGLGPDPKLFDDPERKLAFNQLEHVGRQVAGVEQLRRLEDPRLQQPLGVVLGQSTALRGIDPDVLNTHVRPEHRWLMVTGFGSSFVKLHTNAQTLLRSHLEPGLVVMGVHASMLAGQRSAVADDAEPGEAADMKLHPLRRLKRMIWVRNQRRNISHHTNLALYAARLSLHTLTRSGAVGVFPPAEDPWHAHEREDLPERMPETHLQNQQAQWRRFGWFEPGRYTPAGRQADAFRELVRGCDRLSTATIFIILMPERSQLRAWQPTEAQATLDQLIGELSADRPIVVIDLRDAMPDEAFSDYAHLNPDGRAAFSRLLAERITRVNSPD